MATSARIWAKCSFPKDETTSVAAETSIPIEPKTEETKKTDGKGEKITPPGA